MGMRLIATATTLLLIAAADPVGSQQTCKFDRSQPQTFEQQLSGAACRMQQSGMSAEGITTVLAEMRSEQDVQRRIFAEMQTTGFDLARAAMANPFDSAAFEAALRKAKEVQDTSFSASIEAQIRVLHSLSPADQRLYARLNYGPPVGGVKLGMPTRPLTGSR